MTDLNATTRCEPPRKHPTAAVIVSPPSPEKRTFRDELLLAPSTLTIPQAPPPQPHPTVSASSIEGHDVPTIFVHILFDGVTSSCGIGGDGAGALVTIVSVPQEPSSSSSSSSSSAKGINHNCHHSLSGQEQLPHDESTFKSYRIRQFYNSPKRGNAPTPPTTTDMNSNPNQYGGSYVSRYVKYYIAFIAALRVTLNHMRNIQPTTISPLPPQTPHINNNNNNSTCTGRKRQLQQLQLQQTLQSSSSSPATPHNAYYKIHKIQIEGCHTMIMNTIHFLSHYPITRTTEQTSYLDPNLQHQFDVVHVLLRQLSEYYDSTTTSRASAAATTTTTTTTTMTGVARISTGHTVIANALAKEALEAQKSWMTTSDDYHVQQYPLPTTVVESLTKRTRKTT